MGGPPAPAKQPERRTARRNSRKQSGDWGRSWQSRIYYSWIWLSIGFVYLSNKLFVFTFGTLKSGQSV